MNVKQKQIEFLERFISGDMGVIKFDEFGLCANLKAFSGGYACSKYVSTWENKGRVRSNTFPIPNYNDDYTPKYEGEQLRLRISLAKHLLEGLRDD